MTDRQRAINRISSTLGDRDLIWGGLRADDIEAASDVPQVAYSFAIIGGYDRGGAVPGLDFEDLAGQRVDLDAWDIEDHLDTPAVTKFREALLHRTADRTALLPYRPSAFLSSILFARRDRCMNLGLFGGHQAMFEHKPWVETQVAGLGLPHIPWTYVADVERARARRMLQNGPVMLRVSRSSGGAGLVRVDDPVLLDQRWPKRPDAFVAVAPYLDDALPVNVGATVWHDGVTVRHASVQLIGVPELTTRPFGYCGNDFGLARELDPTVLDSIEGSVTAIGRWMRGYGYLGTFGVDFLIRRGIPLFTEVNARFQGSTHATSQLSSAAGESCVILDHLGAILGHDCPKPVRLTDLMAGVPDLAHFIVHWTGPAARIDSSALTDLLRELPSTSRVDVASKPDHITHTGGVIARATVSSQVTATGFELSPTWSGPIAAWLRDTAAGEHEEVVQRWT